MPDPNTTVQNINTAQIADRLAAYIAENAGCQSKDLPNLSAADLARVVSYVDAIEAHVDYAENAPVLDMPHLDPKIIDLNPLPDEAEFENPFVTHLDRLFRAFHIEVVNGNSSRQVSGIDSNDLARWRTYIANIRGYISGPIASINPGDLPETGGSTGTDAGNS
jgi:hypothetical protein